MQVFIFMSLAFYTFQLLVEFLGKRLSCVISVRPHGTVRIVVKLDTSGLFEKSVDKIKVPLKSEKHNRHCT